MKTESNDIFTDSIPTSLEMEDTETFMGADAMEGTDINESGEVPQDIDMSGDTETILPQDDMLPQDYAQENTLSPGAAENDLFSDIPYPGDTDIMNALPPGEPVGDTGITSTPLPEGQEEADNLLLSETEYTIDDIYTLLESKLLAPGEYSIDDVYTFLESCFPAPIEGREPRDVYTLMETIAENQKTSIALSKVQNSVLLVMFFVLVIICGFVFARIVWRKF